MSFADTLIVHSQFEMDSREEELVAQTKKSHEEEAEQELYRRLGNTLADFQIWPSWTVEDGETSDNQLYKLRSKVVFKP